MKHKKWIRLTIVTSVVTVIASSWLIADMSQSEVRALHYHVTDAGTSQSQLEISLDLFNDGKVMVQGTHGRLRLAADDPYLEIVKGVASFGDIAGQSIMTSLDRFIIHVSNKAPKGYRMRFKLEIQDITGQSWESVLTHRL